MPQIRILPEILSNKIAAGEVVERPASVVKELVENSLDAGSGRILVEVEAGGRSLIRVSDNGNGMSRDDALLSIERYATSKIIDDEDLFAIRTLGFRGEALPSIASVSRFELVSREPDADAGTAVRIEGGRLSGVEETGAPPGTMITVRQLFYNTPARRKFLKAVTTEMGHVADTVARIALGRPAVRFRLIHNGKPVKDWPATESGAERVADVLGQAVSGSLCAVEADGPNGIEVTGWVLPGTDARSTARGIYTFVNGRFVRDRLLQHAIIQAYSGRLMKGRYPVAVLFVTVPPERVDVNVHPTKHEVRFVDSRPVHDTVVRSVTAALSQSDARPWTFVSQTPPEVAEETPGSRRTTGIPEEKPRNPDRPSGATASRQRPMDSPPAFSRPIEPARSSPPAAAASVHEHQALPASAAPHEGSPAPPIGVRGQTDLWARRRFSDLRCIGQFKNTYILCEGPDGLIVIDQHAAHERVMFERLRRRGGTPSRQQLLMPEPLDLGFREAGCLEALIPAFEAIGFGIEPFGGNTFVLTSVPAMLSGREVGPAIREVAEKAAEDGIAGEVTELIDPYLRLLACHKALRASQALTEAEIRSLFDQLDACENPSHCPHGRPTWFLLSVREVEKRFGRIVS